MTATNTLAYYSAYSLKPLKVVQGRYCILSSVMCNENDAEIFPVHYTWKVAEKGCKMAFMTNKLAMFNSCEIQVRTKLVCTLSNI